MVPDLGQADSRVEPEVDKERHTHVQHDVPGQDSVELEVEGHHLVLLDLKHGDHPQGQVTHQEEGDHSTTRLGFHLSVVHSAARQTVQDEDCLEKQEE